MNFFDTQNPGIGGLDELTTEETIVIQNIAALGDPGADRILFWDESANAYAFLTAGSGLTITGTTITASTSGVTGTINEIAYFDSGTSISSLSVVTYPSLTELSYVKGVTSALQTQINSKAPTTSPTFAVSITGSYLTASEILITDASKNIVSAPVATYPSLTELTYLKGVTSAVQTQLNGKAATLSGTINEIAYFNSGSTIASLAVASYPSLAELAYVKGVTSAIQTQLSGKASTALDNLASVAINTSLISDTDNTDDLGTTIKKWANLFVTTIGATATRVTKGWFTDIESTNMPTVGGTSILTSLTAPQFTTIELGHATDTTLSRSAAGVLAVEGVVIPSISSTNTITNKRKQPRVYSAANNASLTPEIDTYDIFHLTAMSAATTINNHSTSTPADGELMEIRFLDNGTARALTWDTNYVAKAGVALPTTTTTSKNLVCLFEYNSNLTKWNLLSSGLEA